MAWDEAAQRRLLAHMDISQVRQQKLEATQHLLGDTIALSEWAWQSPSILPGWTRAHVASHLARNADAFSQIISLASSHDRRPMYADEESRIDDIERGSQRDGLALQIDLDTSAGLLHRTLDLIDANMSPTVLYPTPSLPILAGLIPLARLGEVIIHHADLDCGFDIATTEPIIAEWLVQWILASTSFPGLNIAITCDSGLHSRIGSQPDPLHITAPDAVILGWLTGRLLPHYYELYRLPDPLPLR